jgi:hypothetical protein
MPAFSIAVFGPAGASQQPFAPESFAPAIPTCCFCLAIETQHVVIAAEGKYAMPKPLSKGFFSPRKSKYCKGVL